MILIIGYKTQSKRAEPEVIYAGNDSQAARAAVDARLGEDWARIERLKNPRGHKVPFRSLREAHHAPPEPKTRAGLFVPPAPTPPESPVEDAEATLTRPKPRTHAPAHTPHAPRKRATHPPSKKKR